MTTKPYTLKTLHMHGRPIDIRVWAIWNPLVHEKAVLRIIFNSLWPSELDFLIFTQGKLFSCFAFFENDLCGAGYKNSETQPGIPAPCRALRFHPQEWLVALNLKASERVPLAGWPVAGWPATSQNYCSRSVKTVFFFHNNQSEQYFQSYRTAGHSSSFIKRASV